MKRLISSLLLLLAVLAAQRSMAQIASFSFGGPSTVTGWTNISGDPALAVQTATVGGVTLTTVSRSNWSPNGNGNCVYISGVTGGSYFPAAVMGNNWIQYNGTNNNLALYNVSSPQIELTGLNKDSTYILRMTGTNSYFAGSTAYTVAGATIYGSQQLNTYNNTTQGVTFQNVQPDASGMIRVYVNCAAGTSFCWISGLQIFSGTATNVGVPVVKLTAPVNGTTQSEGGNFVITATASETGGTISKVEFYADTTKIGEADAAPYTMTWADPDPGTYTISAKATDAVGTISTASANVGVRSLNYFWSTTGNIATGGDTSFVGTVDSNRLAFRTKNIERMTISAIGNVGIGTDSPTAQLHTTGSVKFAGLASDSTPSRILVSDSTGKLYYQNIGSAGVLSPGPGLGGTKTGIALGDSIPGPGPHSFTSNRYQYLNGYQYSIGGSVNDPVNRPVFRVYNNGDLVASTTMDRSVNTAAQTGMRFYSKLGVLQIGATDRLDTTINVAATGTGGGIVMNSEDGGDANVLEGRLYDSYLAGIDNDLDSSAYISKVVVSGHSISMTNSAITNSLIAGYGLNLGANIDNSVITGNGNAITKPASVDDISGFLNSSMDTASGTLVAGANNNFGGLWQTVSGVYLTNRTPGGATFGSGNVDFSTLSLTGTKGLSTPGLAGYPLFAVGNSSSYGGFHSNAITVLYNGRTQINTTGFASALTQTQVTPAAALDVVSTNTGVLLPRLTTAQRNAIASGDLHNGLLLYNTDSSAFQYYNGSAWSSVGSGSTSSRWLFSNGTAYDSTDNVAIGTNNPQGYKLAVNGTAIFTKAKVKTAGTWPDYVFGRGYQLPDLKDLEQYLQTHHHLPEIPDQAAVQKDGIDLSEHAAALLKKVEELTLYAIQQDKQLSEQDKQLAEQNARLDAQQKEIDELKALIKDKKN